MGRWEVGRRLGAMLGSFLQSIHQGPDSPFFSWSEGGGVDEMRAREGSQGEGGEGGFKRQIKRQIYMFKNVLLHYLCV